MYTIVPGRQKHLWAALVQSTDAVGLAVDGISKTGSIYVDVGADVTTTGRGLHLHVKTCQRNISKHESMHAGHNRVAFSSLHNCTIVLILLIDSLIRKNM